VSRLLVLGAVLAVTAGSTLAAAPADRADSLPDRADARATALVQRNEAPRNPHLADTAWSANHRNAYAQGSSDRPGPMGPPERIDVHHDGVIGVPIVLTFSPPYADGEYVVWGSTVGPTGEVFKLDPDTFEVIDEYRPQSDGGERPQTAEMSGAYNVLDAEGRLIVGRKQALEVYGDAVPGERTSDVAQLHKLELPPEAFCRPASDESLIGITMTYDGHVAFATSLGNVGVVPRDPALMDPDAVVTHRLNGDACDDPAVGDDDLEQVANTIAADETGGIFVITSAAQYRLDWDGQRLAGDWRVAYDSDRGSGGSLGAGSGSSPTLMGTRPSDDRFVVIYDDADVFNLMLLWRDEIPEDWGGIPGEDRRVACKFPVDFGRGEPEAWSEQSPLVRGYATVLVSDKMTAQPAFEAIPSRLAGWNQMFGGVPGNEPRGVERIDWDPATRTCRTVWERPDLSIPNTIPTMSGSSNAFYAVGVRAGTWTLEALDWDTGEQLFTVPTAPVPTQNSLWAATTVGPDRSIWSGTFGGVTRWQQCADDAEECGRRPSLPEHLVGDPQGVVEGLP
jgi:hypothetical protein